MKTLVCLVAACVLGCGGSSKSGSNGGGGGTAGGGGNGGGGGSAGGGGGGSGGGGGGASVAVSGTVTSSGSNNGSSAPLAGATVAIVGTSSTTTSGADGTFSLMAAAGSTIYLNVSSATYQTSEFGLVVATGGSTGLQLQLISSANVQSAVGALSPALTLDPTKGDVIVQLHGSSGSSTDMSDVAGFGAALGASHGSAFDPNSGTYATTTALGDDAGVLVFPNVVTGTTTVTVTTPTGHSCTAAQAITNWRVDANTFTFVDYNCT